MFGLGVNFQGPASCFGSLSFRSLPVSTVEIRSFRKREVDSVESSGSKGEEVVARSRNLTDSKLSHVICMVGAFMRLKWGE